MLKKRACGRIVGPAQAAEFDGFAFDAGDDWKRSRGQWHERRCLQRIPERNADAVSCVLKKKPAVQKRFTRSKRGNKNVVEGVKDVDFDS